MAKTKFIDVNFSTETMDLLLTVEGVLDRYTGLGLRLTLRQLFYQLVAAGHIENTPRMYKRLGEHVGNGRMAGVLDWDCIEDRVRSTTWSSHWETPEQIVAAAAQQFRIDKWLYQTNHVEVMAEKDAVSGVLEPVCRELDVRFTANRGYSSLSHLYDIGGRLNGMIADGHQVHLLYFGDHDPSGLDMDRDVADRLTIFSESRIHVRRLALTWEQIEEYSPPPNPAKTTDSRASAYIDEHGDESWELDALEPLLMQKLLRTEVLALRDDKLWKKAVKREEEMRARLCRFAETDEEGAE